MCSDASSREGPHLGDAVVRLIGVVSEREQQGDADHGSDAENSCGNGQASVHGARATGGCLGRPRLGLAAGRCRTGAHGRSRRSGQCCGGGWSSPDHSRRGGTRRGRRLRRSGRGRRRPGSGRRRRSRRPCHGRLGACGHGRKLDRGRGRLGRQADAHRFLLRLDFGRRRAWRRLWRFVGHGL